MAMTEDSTRLSRFLTLASLALVVTALYFAEEVLVPLALAIMFSFLLAPLVHRLERWKFPRAVAVVASVTVAFALLAGVGYIVYFQLADLETKLPAYRENIQKKIDYVQRSGGMLAWVRHTDEQVREALNLSATQPATAPSAMPVQVVNQPPVTQSTGSGPFELVREIGAKSLGPVGTALIVVVFSIFMLLQREDLRDRFIRLAGRSRLTTTTKALDDAGERVSRYLLMQSIVNGSVGATIMLLLWLVGKFNHIAFPSPALWGLLAALLRFIPYVGIWIAASMPVLLSLAVFTTSKAAFETLGVYVVVELTAANTFEPLLIGSSTGIATLAVLVAAAFWTWLWGPVGLLLSTPLTVCVVVVGKYVPQLEFLNILLSDAPALSPPDRVYQRLLALDQEEASDLIDEYARQMPLEELYDTILVPALALAEQDEHVGRLDGERLQKIRAGLRDIVEDLGDRLRESEAKNAAQAEVDAAKSVAATPAKPARGLLAMGLEGTAPNSAPGARTILPVGCEIRITLLPANDAADEIVSLMLAQLLELRSYCTDVVSVDKLASEMVDVVRQSRADFVIISALPPAAIIHARYLCKRLSAKIPDLQMLVGLWTSKDSTRAKERMGAAGNVQVAASLRELIDQLHQLAQTKLIKKDDSV